MRSNRRNKDAVCDCSHFIISLLERTYTRSCYILSTAAKAAHFSCGSPYGLILSLCIPSSKEVALHVRSNGRNRDAVCDYSQFIISRLESIHKRSHNSFSMTATAHHSSGSKSLWTDTLTMCPIDKGVALHVRSYRRNKVTVCGYSQFISQ